MIWKADYSIRKFKLAADITVCKTFTSKVPVVTFNNMVSVNLNIIFWESFENTVQAHVSQFRIIRTAQNVNIAAVVLFNKMFSYALERSFIVGINNRIISKRFIKGNHRLRAVFELLQKTFIEKHITIFCHWNRSDDKSIKKVKINQVINI